MQDKLTLDTIGELLGIPSNQVKQKCEQKVTECITILESKLQRPLIKPTIEYDLKGAVSGQAWGRDKVKLNLNYLQDPRYADNMLNDTLPHEVAHCVVNQVYPQAKSHGTEWIYIMALLGLKATRCHNYEIKPARQTKKFSVICRNSHIQKVGLNRARKIARGEKSYYCGFCNTKVDLLDKFIDE